MIHFRRILWTGLEISEQTLKLWMGWMLWSAWMDLNVLCDHEFYLLCCQAKLPESQQLSGGPTGLNEFITRTTLMNLWIEDNRGAWIGQDLSCV